MPTVPSRERTARDRETTRAIRAVQMSAGDKDRSASTKSAVRSRRPDHVTQPKSTNTARLIYWRICQNQGAVTFSGTPRQICQPDNPASANYVDWACRAPCAIATAMGTAWPKSDAKAPRFAHRLEAWGAGSLFGGV